MSTLRELLKKAKESNASKHKIIRIDYVTEKQKKFNEEVERVFEKIRRSID